MYNPHNKVLGNAEIALAMELKSEGIKYAVTAYYLGVSKYTLWRALADARKRGMR